MTLKEILQDLVRRNPRFFEEYEALAQQFFKVLDNATNTPIPEAHAKAMITLLQESGYEIRKRPDLQVLGHINNVVPLTLLKK